MAGKTAIVMAAGLGQRMLPLSEFVPKPMVMIKGIPLLQRIISWLDKHGYKHVYIACGKNDWLIKNYPFIASGDVNITVHTCSNPERGNAMNVNEVIYSYHLKDWVTIVAGDVLTEFPLTAFTNTRNEVVVVKVKDKWSYPVIMDGGQIVSFIEKPDYPHYVNGGVYNVKANKLKFPEMEGGMDWVLQNNRFYAIQYTGKWNTFDTYKDVIDYEQKI